MAEMAEMPTVQEIATAIEHFASACVNAGMGAHTTPYTEEQRQAVNAAYKAYLLPMLRGLAKQFPKLITSDKPSPSEVLDALATTSLRWAEGCCAVDKHLDFIGDALPMYDKAAVSSLFERNPWRALLLAAKADVWAASQDPEIVARVQRKCGTVPATTPPTTYELAKSVCIN